MFGKGDFTAFLNNSLEFSIALPLELFLLMILNWHWSKQLHHKYNEKVNYSFNCSCFLCISRHTYQAFIQVSLSQLFPVCSLPEPFCFNTTLLSTSTVKVTFFLKQCSQNTALQLKLYKRQFFQEHYFRGLSCCPKTAFCKVFPKTFIHLDRKLFTATPWVWYSVRLFGCFVCLFLTRYLLSMCNRFT